MHFDGPDDGELTWQRAKPLLPLGAAITLAVTFTTLSGGGFSSSSQDLFVVFTGIALVCAALLTPDARPDHRPALRSPLVIALAALGLLSVLSALWTIGQPSEAIRWGLVVIAYAALIVVSQQLALRTGPWPFAIGLLVLAVLEAILGLQAEIRHALPDAQRIYGVWRPGGTFEYQPALALLLVGALPVLVSLVRTPGRAHPVRLALVAVCALILGAALARSGERLEPAFAALLLLLLFVRPPAGFTRLAVVLVVFLLAVGAGGADLVFGHGAHAPHSDPGLAHRAATQNITKTKGSPDEALRTVLARPNSKSGGFWHGRLREWAAAFETWQDRPLIGAGTGAYLKASYAHQGDSVSAYAHDLPLEEAAELGILGFLLCVGFYLGTIRELLRASGTLAFALLGSMSALFLVSNLADWTWHLAGMGAIWAACTGALLAARGRVANT